MVARKQPRRWVEFTLDVASGSPSAPVYKWADRPYAGDVFVEGRIAVDGWESVVKALSSMEGEPHIDSASVVLLDTDGQLRELLDQHEFLNRAAAFNLLSEAAWNLGLEPRLLFAGDLYDIQPLDGRKVRAEFEDPLAKYLDRLYPMYRIRDAYPATIDDADFRHVADLGLPIVYGPHIDTRKGLLPAYYVQDTSLDGSPSGPTFTRNGLDPGWEENSVRYSSPGSFSATMGVIAYIIPVASDGTLYNYAFPLNRQAPVNAIDPATGQPIMVATDTWAPRYVWNKMPGVATEFLLIIAGNNVGDANAGFEPFNWPTLTDWARYKVLTASDYIEADAAVGGAANWEYTVDAGFESWGEDFLAGGVVRGEWGELLICEGVIAIPNVYGSDLGLSTQQLVDTTGQPDTTPIRVALSEDRYGVDVLAPGHTGWPHADVYVERNGFRLTVIYAKGALLDHHRNGVVSITVDGCGRDDSLAQDGSGDPIDQAGFVWQDFLSEVVFANDGAGTKGGPKAGVPLDADGRALINTPRVQTFQTLTAARLGTAKGYLCSMALHEPRTLRDILRDWLVTFAAFMGNEDGLFPYGIPDTGNPTDGRAVRERIELKRLPAPVLDHRAIRNAFPAVYGWDPEQQAWRVAERPFRSAEAIARLKGDERNGALRECRFTADESTFADACGRVLLLLSHAPRYQALPVGMQGVDLKLGDQVRVSHQDGLGPKGIGYLERPMIVLRRELVGTDVTATALDIHRLFEGAGQWAGDEVPAYEEATPEQQETYWVWANEDGSIPSGGTGSQWR